MEQNGKRVGISNNLLDNWALVVEIRIDSRWQVRMCPQRLFLSPESGLETTKHYEQHSACHIVRIEGQ